MADIFDELKRYLVELLLSLLTYYFLAGLFGDIMSVQFTLPVHVLYMYCVYCVMRPYTEGRLDHII